MIYHPTNYVKQAQEISVPAAPAHILKLHLIDLSTYAREISKLSTAITITTVVASSYFGFNLTLPLTAALFSGASWILTRTVANQIEPEAQIILAKLKYKEIDQKHFEKSKERAKQELTKELEYMLNRDQAARERWLQCQDMSFKEELNAQKNQIDLEHLNRLKAIVNKFQCWPGYSIAGIEGSHSFWLLIQHTPDFQFQKRCLDYLHAAVLAGEASPIDLAYLEDRIRCEEDKPQLYGTQLESDGVTACPIEDVDNVDKRRQAVGLGLCQRILILQKK